MAFNLSSLFHVVQRFPDRKNTIYQHFKENENFQTICDDYQQCTETFDHWNESTSEEAPARRKEYADLLHELELEILQYLNELS